MVLTCNIVYVICYIYIYNYNIVYYTILYITFNIRGCLQEKALPPQVRVGRSKRGLVAGAFW